MSSYYITTSSALGSAGGWRRVINNQGVLLGYGVFGTFSLADRLSAPNSWTLCDETGKGFVQDINNDWSPVVINGNERWRANFTNRTLADLRNWATTHFPRSSVISPIQNHSFGDVINFPLTATSESEITGVLMPNVASTLQQNDLVGDVPFEYNIHYSFNQWRISGTKTARNVQAKWSIQEIGDGAVSEIGADLATLNTGLYATFDITDAISEIELYVNHTTQEISDVIYRRDGVLRLYSATFTNDTADYVV